MSSMLKISLAAAVLLTVSGCATQNDWGAVGGSKSDAVVRLSYELGALDKHTPDESDGLKLAKLRCGYWGFSGAKPFDVETKTCADEQCRSYTITKEYQCVD
ncbi:putative lipoprotein [Shewanella sediminis HAW-EB3]|uniref:Putative lipoprotein n=2 Tax=Shewanella sediminis TaxID=271097 RepID=A8G1K8_SHESH|nr:putative lipoprotein [Shewanella sediminis HAW-EB3]